MKVTLGQHSLAKPGGPNQDFHGAMLPTGHRILAILSDRVQIERDGATSTLNF